MIDLSRRNKRMLKIHCRWHRLAAQELQRKVHQPGCRSSPAHSWWSRRTGIPCAAKQPGPGDRRFARLRRSCRAGPRPQILQVRPERHRRLAPAWRCAPCAGRPANCSRIIASASCIRVGHGSVMTRSFGIGPSTASSPSRPPCSRAAGVTPARYIHQAEQEIETAAPVLLDPAAQPFTGQVARSVVVGAEEDRARQWDVYGDDRDRRPGGSVP